MIMLLPDVQLAGCEGENMLTVRQDTQSFSKLALATADCWFNDSPPSAPTMDKPFLNDTTITLNIFQERQMQKVQMERQKCQRGSHLLHRRTTMFTTEIKKMHSKVPA